MEHGLGRRRNRNNQNSSAVTNISNEIKDDYPDLAFYAAANEKDGKDVPKTCQLIGKWLFIIINFLFIIAFSGVSVYFHYNSGVVFGQCRL